MKERPNVLVVCGRNKRRSRTAEFLFKNDRRFSIRSVGLSPKSERQLKEHDIHWSDVILVMEDGQARRISQTYRGLDLPTVSVLHIPDEYNYRDTELIDLLTERINRNLHDAWGLE